MYWFLVDETNKNPVPGHFFIVGGLVFAPEQANAIDMEMRRIRTEAGYRVNDSLKFDTNTRPAHVTIERATWAKSEVISALSAHGVRMIVYVILHDIIANQDYSTSMNFALNVVTGAYYDLLGRERATGVMLIDRDNERYDHLEGLFQSGLRYPNGFTRQVDDRIKLFGQTNDNASHLSSAADIALGAFRYCINAAVGSGREGVARAIMPQLTKLVWTVDDGAGPVLRGFGFHKFPLEVKKQAFRQRYEQVSTMLNSYAGLFQPLSIPAETPPAMPVGVAPG
ncbi:hypothetical protein F6J84_08405 [Microbacterium caowuchunii]|uniref:hypothetical protein n=1 Tax=Microbacterium caowuchunii TaxID=2614638 RepID=UPI0012481897|nr:hypothetical protein [Microbacterium caowuchunii]QEW00115.1 hypothetical protein F6J84_08405 [Microbacterium caowuchunii]